MKRKVILGNREEYEVLENGDIIGNNKVGMASVNGAVRFIEGNLRYAEAGRIYFDEPKYSMVHQQEIYHKDVTFWKLVDST